MTDDLKELIASLQSHSVTFLVVGSVALSIHAKARYTEDLDLWLARTEENLDRLQGALTDYGLDVDENLLRAFLDKDRQMIILGAAPHAVDLMNFLEGVSFDDAWSNRVSGSLWGKTVDFIGKRHFIQSKRAAGRPKDLADLALIDEIDSGS